MKYCRDLRLAGQTDWRLPVIGELEGIYDRYASTLGLGGMHNEKGQPYHVKGDLLLTGDSWSVSQFVSAVGRRWGLLFDLVNGRRFEDEVGFRRFKPCAMRSHRFNTYSAHSALSAHSAYSAELVSHWASARNAWPLCATASLSASVTSASVFPNGGYSKIGS